MAKKQDNSNTAKLWVKIVCGILGFLMVFGVLVMLISSLQSAAVESGDMTTTVPDRQISVGLYCNENAVQSYALYAKDGVKITDASGGLSAMLDVSRVIAAVDGNLYRSGGTLTTASGGIAAVGGYHIEISYFTFADLGIDTDHDNPVFIRPGSSAGTTDGYSPANVYDYIALLGDDSSFKAFGMPAFPYYVSADKCYIRVGNFFTKEEAEAALLQLSRTMTLNAEIAEPEDNALTLLCDDYSVLCELSGAGAPYAISSANGVLKEEGGRVYSGSISVSRTNDADVAGMSIINHVSLEDYVAMLISSEISSEWDSELLKSMAVLLRTELVRKLGRHNAEGFDLCADEHCHNYLGATPVLERVNDAVQATDGQILLYEDKPIFTPYSMENGSGTLSASDAFGKDLPYLSSTYTPWETAAEWTVEFTPYELCRILQSAGYSEITGNITSVVVNSCAESSDYVSSITFTDLFGASVTVEGCETIRLLFAGRLPSVCFVAGAVGDSVTRKTRTLSGNGIDYTESEETITLNGTYGSFVFVGSGSGCGVGFSISGARALAEMGYSYSEILLIYFPETTLSAKHE